MQASRVLDDLLKSNKTGRALEGGSRSSKTWSIIQWMMLYCQQNRNKGKEITISRDRLTWLKATVFKDFKEVLINQGWWKDSAHNKSEMTYQLFGNEFSFIGLDEPAKLHGRKQNIFWINEAIGTPGSAYNPSKDVFDQLEMRTTDGWFMDYNPKVTSHWIYDSVLTRPDVDWFKSTMLDNPFLEEKIRQKILSYQPTQENVSRGTSDRVKWLIYGLGERAQHEGLIFTNIQYVKEIPQEAKLIAYGLDFGFTNDVSAMMKVCILGGELWVDEIIYETALTNNDLSRLFEKHGIKTSDEIIADSAEQKSIAELRAKGWNIKGVVKGKDSINYGINTLKKYKLNITENSIGFKKEAENYVWKEDLQTGKTTNIPVDDFNHGWDACFVGSTLVSTSKGEKRIDSIEAGECVLTSKGLRQVLHRWDNGVKLIKKYCLQFDMFCVTLEATENHLIKTSKGWIPISKLKSGQTVYLNKHLMERCTGYTRERDITQEVEQECTLQYGNTLTAKRQRDSMCITKMKTLGITPLKTSNLLPLINTYQNTQSEILNVNGILTNLYQQELKPLKHGTNPMKVISGIVNTQRQHSNSKHSQILVSNVERNTSTKRQKKSVNSVTQTARLRHLGQGEEVKRQVYDLAIDGVHEYFANGLLVHNCRYVALMKLSEQRNITVGKTY